MKNLMRYTAVVLLTLTVLILLWQFRAAILIFLISLFLAAMVRPLITRLVDRGFSGTVAQTFIYVAGFVVLGLGIFLLSGALGNELERLSNSLILQYEALHFSWSGGAEWQRTIAGQIPPPSALIEGVTTTGGSGVVSTLLGVTNSFFNFISNAFLVVILSIYWSADQNRFERLWLSLLPAKERIYARDGWRATEQTIGRYLRSELVQSVLAGVTFALGFWLLGVSYPLLLALLAASTWLLPVIGVFLVAIVVFLGTLTDGIIIAGIATLFTFVVLTLIDRLLEPRLFDRNRFSSVLSVALMIPMTSAYGLAGLLAAPPFAAMLQTIADQFFRYINREKDTTLEFTKLEERYQEVRALYDADSAEEMPKEIGSILTRLEELLEEARQVAG